MQHSLKIQETEYVFESQQDEDIIRLQVGDKEFEIEAKRLTQNEITATINGKRYHFLVGQKNGESYVCYQGKTFKVEDLAKRKRRKKGDSGAVSTEIKPPMPGAIVRVLVEAGQEVVKGEELVVMSAMKMETTLYAPCDGLVKEVFVTEGEQVMPEQFLVDFEPKKTEEN